MVNPVHVPSETDFSIMVTKKLYLYEILILQYIFKTFLSPSEGTNTMSHSQQTSTTA
jgi:hypothetical protein